MHGSAFPPERVYRLEQADHRCEAPDDLPLNGTKDLLGPQKGLIGKISIFGSDCQLSNRAAHEFRIQSVYRDERLAYIVAIFPQLAHERILMALARCCNIKNVTRSYAASSIVNLLGDDLRYRLEKAGSPSMVIGIAGKVVNAGPTMKSISPISNASFR